jgi:hypothetical protein
LGSEAGGKDDQPKVKWRESSLREALRFASGKASIDVNLDQAYFADKENRPNDEANVEYFTDGTAVACMSEWEDAGCASDPSPPERVCPLWWIGEP